MGELELDDGGDVLAVEVSVPAVEADAAAVPAVGQLGAQGVTADAVPGGGGGAGAAPECAKRAASAAWTAGSSECRSQSTRPGYVDGFVARTACRSGR